MKRVQVATGVSLALSLALANGCSSRVQVGDASHLQACSSDPDCAGLGAGYSCVEKVCKVAAADAGADSGSVVPDGGVAGCESVAVSEPVSLADPEIGGMAHARFVAAGQRVVGVWSGAGGTGTRVAVLDQAGTVRGMATVWPTVAAPWERSIAIAGDTVAIADQAGEGADARQTCRLGLVGMGDFSSIQAPTRVSDAPDTASVLNEAQGCKVVATGADFVVVWGQLTSNTSLAWSLFAQRYGQDGTALGERLTLFSDDGRSKPGSAAVTSDGSRVTVAFEPGAGMGSLALVEGARSRVVTLTIPAPASLASVRGGLVATSGTEVTLLDREGAVEVGPVELGEGGAVAPLGTAWVGVSHPDYLVAHVRDRSLRVVSPDTGLGEDRAAALRQLVANPDGSFTAAIYGDGAGLHFSRLSCGTGQVEPPGPPPCPELGTVEPLDDGCTDPVCHTTIRLDYLTLGLRGFATVGGSTAVDGPGAVAAAQPVFDANGQYLSGAPEIQGPEAGLYRVYLPPGDFGAFAFVGAESGAVVAAGGIVWGGGGTYWAPEWKEAAPLACGAARMNPATTYVDTAECSSFDGKPPGKSAQEALDVALRTNVARHYEANGPFSAYVYLYPPSAGGCRPETAEYAVVLTRKR